MVGDTARIDLDIVIQALDGSRTLIQRQISYNKAVISEPALSIKAEADDYQIAYDSNNAKPSPKVVNVKITPLNFTYNPYYEVIVNTDGTSNTEYSPAL